MKKIQRTTIGIISVVIFLALPIASFAAAVPAPPAPTASPAGGTYTEAQTVTIIPDRNATTTYYSLDGSNPYHGAGGILVTDPIVIPVDLATPVVLKAVSYSGSSAPSTIMTETYTFVAPAAPPAPQVTSESGHNKYYKFYKKYKNDFKNSADKNRHETIRKLKKSDNAEYVRLKSVYAKFRVAGDKFRASLPLKVRQDFKKYQSYEGYRNYLHYKDRANQ